MKTFKRTHCNDTERSWNKLVTRGRGVATDVTGHRLDEDSVRDEGLRPPACCNVLFQSQAPRSSLPSILAFGVYRMLKTEEMLPTPFPSFFPLKCTHLKKRSRKTNPVLSHRWYGRLPHPLASVLFHSRETNTSLPQVLWVSYPGMSIISDYVFHVSSGSVIYSRWINKKIVCVWEILVNLFFQPMFFRIHHASRLAKHKVQSTLSPQQEVTPSL